MKRLSLRLTLLAANENAVNQRANEEMAKYLRIILIALHKQLAASLIDFVVQSVVWSQSGAVGKLPR